MLNDPARAPAASGTRLVPERTGQGLALPDRLPAGYGYADAGRRRRRHRRHSRAGHHFLEAWVPLIGSQVRVVASWAYQVGMRPPSMVMSAPVTLAVRSLARMSTRSATSSGRLNRPVTVWFAAWLWTSWALAPVARLTVAATPWSPSHRSVATGPGLIVLTRMPYWPACLDRDLEKLASAALAAL